MSELSQRGCHRGDVWHAKEGFSHRLRIIETWYEPTGPDEVPLLLVERLGVVQPPFTVTLSQLEVAFDYAGYREPPYWSRPVLEHA
jgi:hypothetical protein